MNWELWRLLVDFGLVVLNLVVLLITYPSFLFYSKKELMQWHQVYTFRICLIVMPLMLMQICISFLMLWNNFSVYTISTFIMIAGIWLITFLIAVPIHIKIANNNFDKGHLQRLIRVHLYRTILWCVVFVWTYISLANSYNP